MSGLDESMRHSVAEAVVSLEVAARDVDLTASEIRRRRDAMVLRYVLGITATPMYGDHAGEVLDVVRQTLAILDGEGGEDR